MGKTRKLLMVVASLAMLVSANSQEYKGIVYKLPKGWKESTEGNARVFSPGNLAAGDILAILLAPPQKAVDADPTKQFEAVVGAVNGDAKIASQGTVSSAKKGKGTLVVQAFQLVDKSYGAHQRMYSMFIEGGQYILAMVISRSEATLEKYQADLTDLLTSIEFKGSAPVTTKITALPTGNTPTLMVGMPGWLPSGKGLSIPAPAIVDGKPQGMWYRATPDQAGVLRAIPYVYFPSGVRASLPRLGGGNLFDLEGQKAQKGTTGVGTFTIEKGQYKESADGFKETGVYRFGTDEEGSFFSFGAAEFHVLKPLSKTSIVGSWRSLSTVYVFSEDGTYQSGQLAEGGNEVVGAITSGRYFVDGYLLMLSPNGGKMVIERCGMAGKMLMKGTILCTRQ